MYEKTEQALTISCDACRAVCIVASDHAERWVSPSSDADYSESRKVAIDGRVGIVIRMGRTDHRHRKSEGKIKLPNGGSVVAIRSYPWICEDCYETGGLGKLGDEWKPLLSAACPECQGPTLRFEGEEEKRWCGACREARPVRS